MSDPLLLSGFYCAYEGSFLSNRFQYFFICLMFCPADFLHSSPSPYLKSLKSFYIFFPHCPCFCSIQHHTPYQCLYHPYLQCSVHFSSQKFSPPLRMLLFLLLFFF